MEKRVKRERERKTENQDNIIKMSFKINLFILGVRVGTSILNLYN